MGCRKMLMGEDRGSIPFFFALPFFLGRGIEKKLVGRLSGIIFRGYDGCEGPLTGGVVGVDIVFGILSEGCKPSPLAAFA